MWGMGPAKETVFSFQLDIIFLDIIILIIFLDSFQFSVGQSPLRIPLG